MIEKYILIAIDFIILVGVGGSCFWVGLLTYLKYEELAIIEEEKKNKDNNINL